MRTHSNHHAFHSKGYTNFFSGIGAFIAKYPYYNNCPKVRDGYGYSILQALLSKSTYKTLKKNMTMCCVK